MALPFWVAIDTRPVVVTGTVACRDVGVADVTCADATLAVNRSFAGVVSKFVPVTVSVLPATTNAGVKPLIVGAAPAAVTVKTADVVAV